VTKKDVLAMRIDQSTKIAATTFLRASTDEQSPRSDRRDPGACSTSQDIKVEKLKPEHYSAEVDHRHRDGRGARAGSACQIGEAIEAIQRLGLKTGA
jgi:DNA-directed RNA polymerase subunit beta